MVSWMGVMSGEADKLFAAVLISAMLIGSTMVAALLFVRRPRATRQQPS